MMNCNKMKRWIDEAERADLLAFEVMNHLNSCAPCRDFADERASLRNLLSGMPRVNAPVNFDAQLKARMASARPPLAWLNPAIYLRFGAATAMLCAAVFALQYSGLISLTSPTAISTTATSPGASQDNPELPAQTLPNAKNFLAGGTEVRPPATPVETIRAPQSAVLGATAGGAAVKAASYTRASRGHQNGSRVVDEYSLSNLPGVIVRYKGKEVELPMQPISVGAQSQLMRKAARSAAPTIVMQPVSF